VAGEEFSVKVTGLREVNAALKEVESGLPKAMQGKLKGIAEHVAETARGMVPRRTGAAAGSIRARATQRGAGIAFSDSDGSVSYFPWLNFGGRVGRHGSIERSTVTPDRYIYSTILTEREETMRAVDEAVKEVAGRAGFDTEGSL
jgi:hypothetical protein